MRIVAKCVGGPLDGQRFSVDENQEEVASGQFAEGSGDPVGRYVKDGMTLRNAEGDDVEGFAGHGIEQACDFNYQEATSG